MPSPKTVNRMLCEALEWMREAENLQRQFFGLRATRGAGPCWEPPVDIVEQGNRIVVLMALPGVVAEDVNVIVDEGGIQVLALRPMCGGLTGVMRQLEIPFGRFERRIVLPAGRYDLTDRALADGCLLLKLDRLG